MNGRYRVYGVLGSPYAAKLRAIFRYRRLAFDWLPASFDWVPGLNLVRPELAHVVPRIIPVVWFPEDESYRVDSTVIAYALERLHRPRSIVPDNPGLAFLSHLLEDMGDEWLLKVAFHYRWSNDVDRNFTNRLVMSELLGGGVPQQQIEAAAKVFRDRQISRMPLVGCTPLNAPLIAEVYRRVLDAMTRLRATSSFLLGSRPSLGDFGMFGALFTCRNDPTPGAIMRDRSPATLDWIQTLDEASGIEGEWTGSPADLCPATADLLRLAGETYLPFLLANEAAVEGNKETVSMTALGFPYEQAPFRYQAKCLRWLRQEFDALPGTAREQTASILRETGCGEAFGL
ncbi:glutathione S-transferase C-terminal domain-containing protein [Vineibacter terrae]|uniref:glutathione S-transferase C-terminal domain-containing protein n=1 Tax=Vineibacter terrae TaxID=2586908 RepID=UPI002E35BE92|nr:glutathione S-transferase C-terminal domain-containing protein [Vineibacter terrae]HEX2891524.1 glutathione S-transferase C-terminal domain-containing protein [Vineibacter terrae]